MPRPKRMSMNPRAGKCLAPSSTAAEVVGIRSVFKDFRKEQTP